ncbi:M4 family metallopeptidase [Lihuaxuella thermophila]|uniref:Neutral metalloproteinase n=1 Tax=Lihuaxuella thermophila TaxID=1173111 RepID=A0A1H8BEJ6_9BACL|nr:M4 family metallopeptidase [Lihuaxuella thermophila]SEM81361.1 thermolysin/neutral peptidase B [Lihuaxuella thermophila]
MKKRAAVGMVLSIALGASSFLFQQPAEAKGGEEIRYSKEYKTPAYIGEKWSKPKNLKNEEIVWAYLHAKKSLFKLKGDVKSQFKILKQEKDSLGMTHYRVQEVYHGIPVYGSDQTVHTDRDGNVTSFFGTVIPDLGAKKIQTTAKIGKEQAVQIVRKDLEAQPGNISRLASDPDTGLYIYPHQGNYYLAYHVKVSVIQPEPGYWHYFINAVNGEVIRKYNTVHQLTGSGRGVLGDRKTFEVDHKYGKYYLKGTSRGGGIKTYNAYHVIYESQLPGTMVSSKTNYFLDGAAVDAHAYAEKVYDYFKNVHGRNSYDGNGAPVISSVHVGRNWNNAAWIGTQMVYGDGDGIVFRPLSGALDVVGHELTHAITEKTANLEYHNESGALNESISDIFGAMVDSGDWLLGEDVYTPKQSGDAFRSMSNPTQYDQPDHYSRYVRLPDTPDGDYGGVHINSGINNKAAYLLAEGGTHYGVNVTGIGRAKTAKIYYRALTLYLTSRSTFADMRQAAIKAATDLYGSASQEVQSVKNAYSAVGVY